MNFVTTLRKKMNWSRAWLADKLDMGVSTIRLYENEKRYDGYAQKVPMVFRYALAAVQAGLLPVGGKIKPEEKDTK